MVELAGQGSCIVEWRVWAKPGIKLVMMRCTERGSYYYKEQFADTTSVGYTVMKATKRSGKAQYT